MNQMLFLRLQLMSWSALVVIRPSSKRLWMRPLTSDMPPSGPVLAAHPGEVALPPHVGERDHQDGDEDQPLDVGEGAQAPEDRRPGQQEHRLHVEDDEDKGEDV